MYHQQIARYALLALTLCRNYFINEKNNFFKIKDHSILIMANITIIMLINANNIVDLKNNCHQNHFL